MFNHDVIHILNKEKLKQPSRSLKRRQKLEQIVRQRTSYEDMAKLSLAMPWIELIDTERREFVGLFVQLLCDMFAGRIDGYADEQELYLTEQLEENVAKVRTKLSEDGDPPSFFCWRRSPAIGMCTMWSSTARA